MGCLTWKPLTQTVPFSSPIQAGFQEGMIITVCGRVLPNADRWVSLRKDANVLHLELSVYISLHVTGVLLLLSFLSRFNVNLEHGSDVVLQVNPRYSWLLPISGYVVHNTRQNGKWGWEESKIDTPFPRGETFSLQILITQEAYKVIYFLSTTTTGLFYSRRRITVFLAFPR